MEIQNQIVVSCLRWFGYLINEIPTGVEDGENSDNN